MKIKKEVFCCRFCKKTFCSSQRLKSHLTKKNPCNPILKISDIDDKEQNIIETAPTTSLSSLDSKPFQDLIDLIDDFEIPQIKQENLTDLKCEYCKKILKNKLGLIYHHSICDKKLVIQTQQISNITTFKKQCNKIVRIMSKLLDEKEIQIQELQKQIQEDNKNKTQIIVQQNKIQEKTMDAFAYLQQNHQNTPKNKMALFLKPQIKPSNHKMRDHLLAPCAIFADKKEVASL